jgi:hypothetical protein
MVNKTKKRRSFVADKHNSKTRIETGNKTNPFDLHVNRLKHDVLGKRRNYEKGGQPLKSRSRGIEKVIDFFSSNHFNYLLFHFIRENERY